jgi:hypothetical protein
VAAPVAQLSVKLCEVFDDGTSALVARGLVNLPHRACWPVSADGAVGAEPQPMPLARWVDVTVDLEATSWVFEPGHRLRLSIAGSDWPNAWPPPSAASLEVDGDSLELLLPVLDGASPVAEPPRLAPIVEPGGDSSHSDESGVVWRFEHDVLAATTAAVTGYGADYQAQYGSRIRERYQGRVEVSVDDPANARAEGQVTFEIEWPEARCGTRSQLVVASDADAYEITVELDASLDDQPFARRRWQERIPRRLQ